MITWAWSRRRATRGRRGLRERLLGPVPLHDGAPVDGFRGQRAAPVSGLTRRTVMLSHGLKFIDTSVCTDNAQTHANTQACIHV